MKEHELRAVLMAILWGTKQGYQVPEEALRDANIMMDLAIPPKTVKTTKKKEA